MRQQLLNQRYYIGEEEIGRGAFSTVYPGRDEINGSLVAIKVIDLKKHFDILERIDKEILLHCSLQSEHVVRLLDHFSVSNKLYIVTEYCAFGDLHSFVQRFPACILPEDIARLFSFQIVVGFLSLLEQNLIHRDIKLTNILLNRDFSCKIGDFGLAKSRNDPGQSQAGSPITMAPEILLGQNYNYQCDIWSFGCIVYALLHGRYPFAPKRNGGRRELEQLVLEGNIEWENANVSVESKEFILKLLKLNPNERISWEDMFRDPWFAPCNELYAQTVIRQYNLLETTIPHEVHMNTQFAMVFGYQLFEFVEQVLTSIPDTLEIVISKFTRIACPNFNDKKTIYYIHLLIASILTQFKISFEQIIPITLNTLNSPCIKKLKSLLSETDLNRAMDVVKNGQLDFEPISLALGGHLLQIIKREIRSNGTNAKTYKDDNCEIVRLVELLARRDVCRGQMRIDVSMGQSADVIDLVCKEINHISVYTAYLDSLNNHEAVREILHELPAQFPIEFVTLESAHFQNSEAQKTFDSLKEILQLY